MLPTPDRDGGAAGPPGLREAGVVALVLVLFACLALRAAAGSAPTYDEPTHLAAGYSYLRFHDFRLNPEHPPLVKLLAALPLLGQGLWPATDDGSSSRRELERLWDLSPQRSDGQWAFAHELFYGVTDAELARSGVRRSVDLDPRSPPARDAFLHDPDRLWRRARLAMVAFALALLAAVWFWSRALWGAGGALLSLAVAAFDPSLLGHAPLVATDVAFALFAFGSALFLWRLRRRWSPVSAAFLLASVALAFASKHSAIVWFPLLVLLALLPAPSANPGGTGRRRLLALLLLALVVSAIALWSVYGFRYSAVPGVTSGGLPDIEPAIRRTAAFQKLAPAWPEGPPESELARVAASVDIGWTGRSLLFARDHRLLPEAYLAGLTEARRKGQARWSYLDGEISLRGFRSYFARAFLYKSPLPLLLLLAAAAVFTVGRWRSGRRSDGGDLLLLWLPPLVWFALSSASHLNIGHRHLLPVYPFLWVLCGLVVAGRRDATATDRGTRRVIAAALTGLVVAGSAFGFARPLRPERIHPHYLSYFNELAGGPAGGSRHLVDSNLDWGQDLPRLATWLEEREIRESIGLCYFGMADPRYYGFRHVKLPGGYLLEPPLAGAAGFEPARGMRYVAISATLFRGVYLSRGQRDAWTSYLRGAELVDTVGHSIFIFRLAAPS
ncbi:MAG: hypothetical protein AB7G12_08245 [Thermoanaerobaculia bacterium]